MKLKRTLLFLSVFYLVLIGKSFASDAPVGCEFKDANNTGNFCFAVIGDRTGGERKGYFESKVVKCLNLLTPSFVLNVGDNIGGYTEDVNVVNKQWDNFEKSIKELQMPLYRVAGNHDIANLKMAQIYKQRYGQPYFHIIYKNILFLFINTEDPSSKEPPAIKKQQDEEMVALKNKIKAEGYTEDNIRHLDDYEVRCCDLRGGQITDEQFNYFEKVLKENTNVRWIFVVMHKPVYKETNPPANWLKLEKLLSGHPYTVFAGHKHRYEYISRNGRDYITLATSGGRWSYPQTSTTGVYDSLLLVNMTDKGPLIANILIDAIFDKADVRAVKVEEYPAVK